ncbi:MAG: histidinol dehydrogenase [Candidatus Sumerlaeaceae bacterium]|jgi:histidinol dehydrogenase
MMKYFEYPRDRENLVRAFRRTHQSPPEIVAAVEKIIRAVEREGDKAVIRFTKRFDGVELSGETLRVAPDICQRAWRSLSKELSAALTLAKQRIERFHRKQLRKGYVIRTRGMRLEQRIRPLKRVGVYVPGGRAIYPSTVLMNAIPALIAGVPEIYIVTPPVREDAQHFTPFAVAHQLGLGRNVFQVGGAQAVAALAFGTETIPQVDKVVGPGNIFVATAKRLLYGQIDIDSVAGESEVLIIADKTARADFLAADLLAQAEHTGSETVVLVGIGADFDFDAVERELRLQLQNAPRRQQALSSLRHAGFFVRVDTPDEAVEVAELKAPEHLEIITRAPEKLAARISNVGAIFLGAYTPEAVGDYIAGPNHVLPTAGTARFFSPLGVDAFLKASNVLCYEPTQLEKDAPHVIALAESEGLYAHAESMRIRTKKRAK